MTSRVGRATVLLAAGLLCGGCSLFPRTASSPAPVSTPRRPAATASPPLAAAAPPLALLLPFPPARLEAAAALAGRFTTAWDTWSWQQPPAAWLARLQPMATPTLEVALAQAAGDRGVQAQRAAARQATTATVTALAISGLTPGSVTITVTARQVTTTRTGTSQATARFAVTLTPRGSGWAVWDIEPADAGNS